MTFHSHSYAIFILSPSLPINGWNLTNHLSPFSDILKTVTPTQIHPQDHKEYIQIIPPLNKNCQIKSQVAIGSPWPWSLLIFLKLRHPQKQLLRDHPRTKWDKSPKHAIPPMVVVFLMCIEGCFCHVLFPVAFFWCNEKKMRKILRIMKHKWHKL